MKNSLQLKTLTSAAAIIMIITIIMRPPKNKSTIPYESLQYAHELLELEELMQPMTHIFL